MPIISLSTALASVSGVTDFAIVSPTVVPVSTCSRIDSPSTRDSHNTRPAKAVLPLSCRASCIVRTSLALSTSRDKVTPILMEERPAPAIVAFTVS